MLLDSAVRAGSMNERVTIRRRADVQDANGEMVPGWADVATLWASVVDITGREYISANATSGSVQTKITIRYMDGILPTMRVIHGANTYEIQSVLGHNRISLTLMCTRQT